MWVTGIGKRMFSLVEVDRPLNFGFSDTDGGLLNSPFHHHQGILTHLP